MQFKLQSSFKPTGDQPQAIQQLTRGISNGTPHQTLLGVTGSGKTFTLANVIHHTQKPTLVISHNKTLAAQLYQEFRDFFPQNAVSYFVSYYDYYQPEAYIANTDTYIEKETDINDEIDKLRLSATANLLTRKDVIVVASVSCIYNLGSPLEYLKNFLEIVSGQIISRQSLITRLIDIQYSRSDYELKRGSFRIQGDTLTIWPANVEYALRLNLLENVIQEITPIHPTTGQLFDLSHHLDYTNHPKPNRYIIYPAKHYQTNSQNQKDIFQQIKKELAQQLITLKSQNKILEAHRLNQRVRHDLDMIQEFGYVNGIENYSRYFDGRQPGQPPYTLIDYFHYNAQKFQTQNFLTIIDESHITIPQIKGMYYGDRSRKENLVEYGFRLPSALDNRPLQFAEVQKRLPQIIYSSATPSDWEIAQSQHQIAQQLIRPTGLVDPEIEIRPSQNQIPNLVKEIIQRKKLNQRVLVTTLTKRTAEALAEYLNDPHKIDTLITTQTDNQKSNQARHLKSPNIQPPLDTEKTSIYPQVAYLHADVETLDRSDILDDLRSGNYDVVVGINLLREGLDLPEVSLVAIIEADKEGFLRSQTSLIQTMGRAARHQQGKVIMYADQITTSMQSAIDEVNRRRTIQKQYNQDHHITPETIQKPLRNKLLDRIKEEDTPKSPKELQPYGWETLNDINPNTLTPKDKKELIKQLKKRMNQAAKDWDFEAAAHYRNTITKLV